MKPSILFITGSDTGVGKTVLAALLTRYLREAGHRVVGLKPISSGGRGDARALRAAAGNVFTLDETNPWHFRAAIAPLLAARRERRRVRFSNVVSLIRRAATRFEYVVVEGAGGLLSPLGEGFDSREMIVALGAKPIVVCANRLGAVNQALLVLSALPPRSAAVAQVVLSDVKTAAASASNPMLLRELIGNGRVHHLPQVKDSLAVPRRLRPLLSRLAG